MKRAFYLLAVAAMLLPSAGFAASYEIDPVHSSVGFRIRHLVSRVNGTFDKVSGTIDFDEKQPKAAKVNATIEIDSVNTRNDRRDAHLKSPDFFDAAKYPTMTFTSKKVTPAGKNHFRILGDLTMHGVCKPVVLDVEYTGKASAMGGTRAGFTATTKLNRKDYGVVWNKVLDQGGTMLGDDVDITLEIEAVEKK